MIKYFLLKKTYKNCHKSNLTGIYLCLLVIKYRTYLQIIRVRGALGVWLPTPVIYINIYNLFYNARDFSKKNIYIHLNLFLSFLF